MEDDLQSAGLSRERVALFVGPLGPRCLLRPDPPPLFRVPNCLLVPTRFLLLKLLLLGFYFRAILHYE